MRKRRIASIGAILATLAGVLVLVAPSAASAASAESVYSRSYIVRCASVYAYPTHDCIWLQAYATYSQQQIWINGNVNCNIQSGEVTVTWCGVGGGNGTFTLNIGENFRFGGVNTALYERMDIDADGYGCNTWGSNQKNENGINHWWNDLYACELVE